MGVTVRASGLGCHLHFYYCCCSYTSTFITCTLSDTNTTDILTTEYYPDEPEVLVVGQPEGSEVNSSKIGYEC